METRLCIETERLLLRPPTIDDAASIFARYGQDRDVSRYMSWKPHRSLDDTREFLDKLLANIESRTALGYLIFAKHTELLLGSVGGEISGHLLGFGYCLARDAWGNGFATEAARAFVKSAWANSSLVRIAAMCDVENMASARVLEKVGLTREGILRKYLVLPNLGDSPRDVYMYATVRNKPSANI